MICIPCMPVSSKMMPSPNKTIVFLPRANIAKATKNNNDAIMVLEFARCLSAWRPATFAASTPATPKSPKSPMTALE